jgi:hypothetical protein
MLRLFGGDASGTHPNMKRMQTNTNVEMIISKISLNVFCAYILEP